MRFEISEDIIDLEDKRMQKSIEDFTNKLLDIGYRVQPENPYAWVVSKFREMSKWNKKDWETIVKKSLDFKGVRDMQVSAGKIADRIQKLADSYEKKGSSIDLLDDFNFKQKTLMVIFLKKFYVDGDFDSLEKACKMFLTFNRQYIQKNLDVVISDEQVDEFKDDLKKLMSLDFDIKESFFKDEDDREETGTRAKNPHRVMAAKLAHKKYRGNYKMGQNRRKESKQESHCSKLANFMEDRLNEATLKTKNAVNLYAEINFENLTGGFQVKVDGDNYSNIGIPLVSVENGWGNYVLEGGESNKEQTTLIFNTLVNDLKNLADSIDNDFKAILKKNGLVRKVD